MQYGNQLSLSLSLIKEADGWDDISEGHNQLGNNTITLTS